MSRRDDRLQAQLWLDDPGQLSERLMSLLQQLDQTAVARPSLGRRAEPQLQLSLRVARELAQIGRAHV